MSRGIHDRGDRAGSVGELPRRVVGAGGLVAKGVEELLEKAVELLFLALAQRGEQLAFPVGSGVDVLIQLVASGRGELEQDTAPIVGIAPQSASSRWVAVLGVPLSDAHGRLPFATRDCLAVCPAAGRRIVVPARLRSGWLG
jgi:hypothetical protein